MPNQSTLLNALVGQKVSIATSKAQTTRRETLGVFTKDNVQLVSYTRIAMSKGNVPGKQLRQLGSTAPGCGRVSGWMQVVYATTGILRPSRILLRVQVFYDTPGILHPTKMRRR